MSKNQQQFEPEQEQPDPEQQQPERQPELAPESPESKDEARVNARGRELYPWEVSGEKQDEPGDEKATS